MINNNKMSIGEHIPFLLRNSYRSSFKKYSKVSFEDVKNERKQEKKNPYMQHDEKHRLLGCLKGGWIALFQFLYSLFHHLGRYVDGEGRVRSKEFVMYELGSLLLFPYFGAIQIYIPLDVQPEHEVLMTPTALKESHERLKSRLVFTVLWYDV